MNYSLVPLLAAVFTLLSIPVQAGGPPKPTPVPHHGRIVIASVNSSQIVTETRSGKKIYKINERTECYYKAHRAAVAELAAGMRVVVTPTFNDPTTAAKIEADEAPKPDPTPKK